MKISPLALLFTLLPAWAFGQEGRKAVYVSAFYGQNQLMLGSTDTRRGGGLSISRPMPWRMMRIGRYLPDIVVEGYVARSHGKGNHVEGENENTEIGGLAIHRTKWGIGPELHVFTELGMGLMYTDHLSIDLDSRINSTPMVGGGFLIGRDQQYVVTLRLIHISNGGLTQRNFGQNRLYLGFGLKL